MSGTQHLLRSFIEERLTAAAVEIFGVVEKTISEYEEQVVQSKRELEQLRQDITHLNTLRPSIQLYRTDSQPVSEELLSPHHSPQVKEEQPELSFIPHSETSVYNSGANGFVESQTTSDSQRIPSYSDESVQHQCPQVKEEQLDLIMILPDSETSSSSNIVTKAFVSSESTGDSQPTAFHATETTIANRDVANKPNENEGPGTAFNDAVSEQKICHFCRKQFNLYSDLRKHVEQIHKGHKAFRCNKCHREFARRDQLNVHSRIHSGLKPHACPVCGKQFTQRSTVKAHMLIHTGDKPHSCPVCEKSFTRRYYLNTHMRAHHAAEEPYLLQQTWQNGYPQMSSQND